MIGRKPEDVTLSVPADTALLYWKCGQKQDLVINLWEKQADCAEIRQVSLLNISVRKEKKNESSRKYDQNNYREGHGKIALRNIWEDL